MSLRPSPPSLSRIAAYWELGTADKDQELRLRWYETIGVDVMA